jgi:hypothetical protein
MESKHPFFQDETKFIVGEEYETLRVNEVENIIPDTVQYLGRFVRCVGGGGSSGDGRTRDDFFTKKDGEVVKWTLACDGSTRFRRI